MFSGILTALNSLMLKAVLRTRAPLYISNKFTISSKGKVYLVQLCLTAEVFQR